MLAARKRKPKLHLFFSHSHKDARAVQNLAREIARAGAMAWAYEYSLNFGERIASQVHKAIYDCDFFIVVASQAGLQSDWVARETWLAEFLLRERGNHNPRVLAYVPPREAPPSAVDMKLQLRNFETGDLTGETKNLNEVRAFFADNPEADRLDDFYRLLSPSIRIFGRDYEDGDELMDSGVFEAYKKLFPETEEQDDPEDIVDWLGEGPGYLRLRLRDRLRSLLRRGRESEVESPWGEWFATFDVGGRAVGLVYLSIHKPTGWAFGNYFGLLESWRPHQRAQWFLDEVLSELGTAAPHLKGVIFEVHPFERDAVMRLKNKLEKAPMATDMSADERTRFLTKEEAKLIKAIRRVHLYVRHGARVILGRSGGPLWYRQPAMEVTGEPSQGLEAGERSLWLMFYPIGKKGKRVSAGEVLDVVYLELFGQAYGPTFAEKGFNYMPRIAELRERSLADASSGPLMLGKGYSRVDLDVVRLAQTKGFNVDL